MHILLIHQAFTAIDEPGGTRHHEIARQLAESDLKVTVITGQVSYLTGQPTSEGGWVNREVDDCGVEILKVSSYQQWHRSFVHRMFSFVSFMISSFLIGMRTKQVDVVWGTTPPLFQGFTSWLLARMKKAKFLFEVRDLWPKFAVAVGVLSNPLLIWLSEGLERFLYRRADQIVINSPGFQDHLIALGAKSTVLIPNGVDVGMFSNESGAMQPSSVDAKDMFNVLYTGAHGEANDLNTVLEAALHLRDEKMIRFVLIGDGKEKESLISRASELGIDNVLFLPPVPKGEMPQVLANADVCLAILKPIEEFKTTYPNKVFDYMAAGKPVVLAIDGVIRDLLEEANAGLFVQPGDEIALAEAVLKLWQNPGEGERMGQAGRAYVREHFDRSIQVEAFTELLQEMTNREI